MRTPLAVVAIVLMTSAGTVGDVEVIPITVEPELWRPGTDISPPPRVYPVDFEPEMPDITQGNTLPGPARTGFAIRDLQTGETTEYSGMPRLPHAPMGWQIPDMYDYGEEQPGYRNFGTMALANSPDVFPASVNCRLFITYTDVNGNDLWGQCSGTMIDPEVILTAAHCVYYGVRNGRTVNDFASSVVVQPATHQGTDFYGTCNSTAVGAAVGYTDAAEDSAWGDWDWDVGIVIVNRAAGHLTNWHSLAWDGSCSAVQDLTYHNYSYPGANCGGTDGSGNPLHNGIDMYYWNGDWDSCPSDTLLQMDTPNAGCLDAVWGGMSGSSAYYIDGDSRYAHAVCSNGPTPPTYARYTRLWEAIADWIIDDIESLARGDTLDLQSLNFNQNGDEVISADAFDLVPDLSVKSANPTNGSASSQSWPISVRLSDNDTISTSDTELLNGTFTWAFDSISSVNVNLNDVRIPVNTPTGTHFIGAIIDDGSVVGNNDSSDWDALEVTVTAVSEAEALSVAPLGGELDAGEQVQIDFSVGNNGGATATGLVVKVMASLNDNITEFDVLLAQSPIGDISPEDTDWYSWSPVVPDELIGDDWFIGIIVEHPDDVIGSNNTAISGWTLPGVDRPQNDDMCDASLISGGLHAFDTTWATTDGASHDECQYTGQTHRDIWYAYQTPSAGRLTVTTCEDLGGSANYDTDLVVYSGSSCNNMSLVACNDDDPDNDCGSTPDYHSTVQIDVQANEWYLFRVGGYGSWDSGQGELFVETRIPNDECEDAIPIEMGDTWYSTVGATTDGAAYGNCQFGGYTGNDIWYTFTAECTGTFTASTCGQVDYDSDLVLFQGTDCIAPDFVACNDDAPGCPDYSSILEADVEAGVLYMLRVGGYEEGHAGSGTITLTCTPNESGGDVDGDGDTDIDDMLAILSAWGSDDPDADLNDDGIVDIEDLLLAIAHWTG